MKAWIPKDERIPYFMGFITGVLFTIFLLRWFNLAFYVAMPLEVILFMLAF